MSLYGQEAILRFLDYQRQKHVQKMYIQYLNSDPQCMYRSFG